MRTARLAAPIVRNKTMNPKCFKYCMCICLAALYLVFSSVCVAFCKTNVGRNTHHQANLQMGSKRLGFSSPVKKSNCLKFLRRQRVVLYKRPAIKVNIVLLACLALFGIFSRFAQPAAVSLLYLQPLLRRNRLATLCLRQV